jgi:hypothetical protein
MDKCLKYQNNGYFDAYLEKRREKKRIKDNPCFLAFVSKFKRENSKEHGRIRIGHHKYPPHSIHLHILI